MDVANRGLDLEKELTCSICTELLYQPLTLLDCLHTFCGSCLKDWFSYQLEASRNSLNPPPPGTLPYTCPSCRAPVRETKPNATVTTLLDMYLAANPDRSKSEEEKEEMRQRYTHGEEVMPKVPEREQTSRERREEEEDRRLMEEVRDLSLREVGVDSSSSEGRRRRRREERSSPAPRTAIATRDSSSNGRSDDRRDRRHRPDAQERRRRRAESAAAREERPVHGTRARYVSEGTRRRHEETSRTAARQIEHQSSLRSLISTSDVDSHEMEEEILRQIEEEGLLDGIDLENIDVDQEDQISERIAEAFRRRQREKARAGCNTSSQNSANWPLPMPSSTNNSGEDSDRRSRRPRTHSRSESAVRHADEPRSSGPDSTFTHLQVQPGDGRRRRTRSSTGRSSTQPVSSTSRASPRPSVRSTTDLNDRPSSSRSNTDPNARRTAVHNERVSNDVTQPGFNTHAPPTSTSEARDTATPPREPLTSRGRTAELTPASELTSTPLTADLMMDDQLLIPSPLAPRSRDPSRDAKRRSLTDRSMAIQSAARPTASGSGTHSPRPPLYPEPNLTCARCEKPHIEYDLHYNCGSCHGGNWNICLNCYRAGRGCLHWFGFGYSAWKKFEKLKSEGTIPTDSEPPHMMTANRYLPPPSFEGGANGRRTLTHEDPHNRLQSGAFCASCSAWANQCYWRCDICNEGDWGFCNICVNQGRFCTHALLPLVYRPHEDYTPPPTLADDQHTPVNATVLKGPGVIEFGSFKPLTFAPLCEVCHDPIQPSSTRYHCFTCRPTTTPGLLPGDYNICNSCYTGLVTKGRISPENGPDGWRRCLNGHRMVIVGFQEVNGGQRRIIISDLIGGRRCLRTEPYTPPPGTLHIVDQELQLWVWASGSCARLVTNNVAESAPTQVNVALPEGMQLSSEFPPEGEVGMRAMAGWSWYPKEGEGANELLFPRGAEIREVRDVNGDWFLGTYMSACGLFPAPYVKVVNS